MNKLVVSTSLFLVTITLSGCATPYRPNNLLSGGYTEKEISPNVYEVKYIYNKVTGARAVQQYWHRRAAELCKGEELYKILEEPKEHFLSLGITKGKIECIEIQKSGEAS